MKSELNPTRFTEVAALGLRVFPCRPSAKEPAVTWTDYKERAPTPDELAQWDTSPFNIGVITGASSGIVVLDVDSAEAQALVDGLDLPPNDCSWLPVDR